MVSWWHFDKVTSAQIKMKNVPWWILNRAWCTCSSSTCPNGFSMLDRIPPCLLFQRPAASCWVHFLWVSITILVTVDSWSADPQFVEQIILVVKPAPGNWLNPVDSESETDCFSGRGAAEQRVCCWQSDGLGLVFLELWSLVSFDRESLKRLWWRKEEVKERDAGCLVHTLCL